MIPKEEMSKEYITELNRIYANWQKTTHSNQIQDVFKK